MTEPLRYTSAVEDFVGKQNGGELTPQIIYEFVKALNADNMNRHNETMDQIAELRKIVGGRAEAIEVAKQEVLHEVETREHWPVLDKAIAEICSKLNNGLPRRSYDPPTVDWSKKRGTFESRDLNDPADSQFTEIRETAFPTSDKNWVEIMLGYRFIKWAVGIAVGAIIIFSASYYAEACAMRDAELIHEPEPETHQLVVPASASPYPEVQ